MKFWFLPTLGLVAGLAALGAEPAILLNTLTDRPVFSYVSGGLTQSRTLAPGNRISLDAGTFSGLGEKNVGFSENNLYYLARFEGLASVYRLEPNQFLILNASGRPVLLSVGGPTPASGFLTTGSFALGGIDAAGEYRVQWDDGTSGVQQSEVLPGRVYRLLLESPEGIGVSVSLVPWD